MFIKSGVLQFQYSCFFLSANPDLLSGTGVGVFHYLQSVSKNLALGAELVYQSSPQLPGTVHIFTAIFHLIFLTQWVALRSEHFQLLGWGVCNTYGRGNSSGRPAKILLRCSRFAAVSNYYCCGSGSASTRIRFFWPGSINLVFCLSKRLLYLRGSWVYFFYLLLYLH